MPIAVRDDLSEEALLALLDEGSESETLDYKKLCNIAIPFTFLQIVKDVAAMQLRGGYIVIGADDHGVPSGEVTLDHWNAMEPATFRNRLVPYLGSTIDVKVKLHQIDGNYFILIYVGKNPRGFVSIKQDGQLKQDGQFKLEGQQKITPVFSRGVVYTRHGTSNDVWEDQDTDLLLDELVAQRKESWMKESTEMIAASLPPGAAIALASAPVGALDWSIDGETFIATATEMLRRGDTVPIRMLLTGVGNDVSAILGNAQGAERAKTVLDRLACLAALALRLDDQALFRCAIAGFVAIYQLPVDRYGSPRFEQAMPRANLWFEVMQRVIAVGGLAERLEAWGAVRELVLQQGKGSEFDYHPNWYRHGLTRSAQASLIRTAVSKQTPPLLSFAQQQADRLACLRFDIPAGDDELLSSICRFDFLAGVVAMGSAGDGSDRTYYPSFAKYYEARTRPAAEALIDDHDMRQTLFPLDDKNLATALFAINNLAAHDARLRSWSPYFDSAKVREFVEKHGPK